MLVLLVGGEDHHLRIPFLLALRERGCVAAVAASCASAPFERAGITFAPFRFGRFMDPVSDMRAVAGLAKILRDLRPEIVQCFDTKPNLLGPLAARLAGHKGLVRTVNGMGWIYSSSSVAARALRPAYRTLHRVAARSAALTVFQNREDEAHFSAHGMLGGRPSLLIPGSGVDVEGFERAQADGLRRDEARRALGLTPDDEVVLTVTRLTRQKGIPSLLRAAALVHAVRPRVRFVLAGPREGEGRDAVSAAEIQMHAPYVLALGPRNDVPSLLGMADVFVFPTEYREGVPRALLEAGLAGLPIVATRMPGCTDVVRDGWSGRLAPPRSPARLAAAVLAMLEDRRAAAEMAANAAAHVRREFPLATTVDRYLAAYSQVAACANRRSDSSPIAAVPSGRIVEAGASPRVPADVC